MKISLKEELRERNHGDYNGKKAKIIADTFDMSDPRFVLPNGESINQMKKRVLNFISKIEKSESVLIVTHEGCLRAILSYVRNKNFLSNECSSKPEEIRILDIQNKKIRLLNKE